MMEMIFIANLPDQAAGAGTQAMASSTEAVAEASGLQSAQGRRFLFGPVVFNEQTLELTVNGHAVELERKPLEVLRHLLLHAGEVVTKDELAEACWPGRILSDTVLAKAVSRLRDGLADEQQALIKTLHGYGYRLVAPVQVEAVAAVAPPRFDFKAGDPAPLRPLWKLEQRLGTGGHGEAWLGRHEKTREARVFKYALDGSVLTSLKREITLYRLLHDTLGEREDFVRVLDWNLAEAPYFVEFEHSNSGNLLQWATSQNGLLQVPLASRIAMAIRIAEALAACHSVGVLHKDLKPANVLVVTRAGSAPAIKLADFGSGGVLDLRRLESLGITRLGFTHTLAQGTTSGTTQYLPPEVMAGQPSTVQADIYALGVILYQLVIGDLRKPLASGWEYDISDELLREDIADATHGNPARRLADAARLAERLALLGPRREQRTRETQARVEAEQQRIALGKLRARRAWMLTSMAILIVGMSASLALYLDARRARNEAAASAAISQAVSDFLGKDMFGVLQAEQRPVKNLTVKELLDAASAQVEKRFANAPEAAAQVHAALGSSYSALEYAGESAAHLERALALYQAQQGSGSEREVETAAQLVELKYLFGGLQQALPEFEAVLAHGDQRLGKHHPAVLRLRQRIISFGYSHDLQRAVQELRLLIKDALGAKPIPEALVGESEQLLGQALVTLAEFDQAERVLRGSIERLSRAFGTEHQRVALARMSLGNALGELERYAEAEKELAQAERIARRWAVDERSGYYLAIRADQSELHLRQNRAGKAETILKEVLAALPAASSGEVDQSAPIRKLLAEALHAQGRAAEAVSEMRAALASSEKEAGPQHRRTVRIRIALADLLREQQRAAEARVLLEGIEPEAIRMLPPRHPVLAELRRSEGLLALHDRRLEVARTALNEALQILQFRYGPDHWRTRQVRAELGLVPQSVT
jgi:non-specific serine/threonine protein kinase